MYSTTEWKRLRLSQLAKEPLCKDCESHNRITLATVADHVEDHKGDKYKFFHGKLQSLCKPCHSKKTIRENLNKKTL